MLNLQVRCVGLTIGIERLFAIIMARKKLNNKYIRSCPVDVYVASAQKGMHEEREILCNLLWEAGIGVSKFFVVLVLYRKILNLGKLHSKLVQYFNTKACSYNLNF